MRMSQAELHHRKTISISRGRCASRAVSWFIMNSYPMRASGCHALNTNQSQSGPALETQFCSRAPKRIKGFVFPCTSLSITPKLKSLKSNKQESKISLCKSTLATPTKTHSSSGLLLSSEVHRVLHLQALNLPEEINWKCHYFNTSESRNNLLTTL